MLLTMISSSVHTFNDKFKNIDSNNNNNLKITIKNTFSVFDNTRCISFVSKFTRQRDG